MRCFYDCEFLEDGRTIDLISIGMVAEDGRELYAVNEAIAHQPLHDRICKHQWLMENVVPGLPLAPEPGWEAHGRLRSGGFFDLDLDSNVVMPKRMIRNTVREFLAATPDVELWAWYGAYDHVALAQLFGPMVDLPSGVPMWTNDVQQEWSRLGRPALPEQESALHNALDDARHVRTLVDWLAQYDRRTRTGIPVATTMEAP